MESPFMSKPNKYNASGMGANPNLNTNVLEFGPPTETGSQKATLRSDEGGSRQVSNEQAPRETPFNQHGHTGKVEPASVQPQIVAILPKNASYQEFAEYVEIHKGPKTDTELEELWDWRQKLLGVKVITGSVARSMLPPDEQHLTLKEREKKVISEAEAAGIQVERAPS